MVTEFEKELSALINKYSGEQDSNTPDFILAAYLNDCLLAFNKASAWRSSYYSPEGVPAHQRESGPKHARL